MRFSTLTLIAIVLMAAVLIAGCTAPQPAASPTPAPAPALTPVKVAYQPTVANGPFYIGREEGYFAEQGIDLQLVKVAGFTASFPLLVSGDLDASTGPVNQAFVNAVQDGSHVRIVADKGSVLAGRCTPQALMVRKDLYDKGVVRNVSDLKGLKVYSSAVDYEIAQALALGNLTKDDVTSVTMDYPSAVVAFRNGAVDAGTMTEPYITQLKTDNTAVVLAPSQDYIPGWGLPLFFGPSILDRNPEIGKKFMVAYLKSVRQYNEGKTPRNLAIIGNYTGMQPGILNESCWYPIADDAVYPTAPVRTYLDWGLANKKFTADIDVNQLFDMSYVQYANGVLQNASAGKSQSR